MLSEIGFTPREALQAATSSPAQFLQAGGAGGCGTIQAGRVADLVLLESDPLADIANTKKIAAVVVAGKFLDRAALDRLLAEAHGVFRQARLASSRRTST